MSWQSRASRSFAAQSARWSTKLSTWARVASFRVLVPQKSIGVGLHEIGIELVLADELAEAVADAWAAVSVARPVAICAD